jgi:Tol biopolymer transport system component
MVDGEQVVYQRAAETTSIVVADRLGNVTGTTEDYTFPRFGMAADWSPDGRFLAVAGHNGQCPYGLIVFNQDFQRITGPASNLLACDPIYAPSGDYMAFTGISTAAGFDGRVDIYLAGPNGLGARNLTSRLQGPVQMVGWVGPVPGGN